MTLVTFALSLAYLRSGLFVRTSAQGHRMMQEVWRSSGVQFGVGAVQLNV